MEISHAQTIKDIDTDLCYMDNEIQHNNEELSALSVEFKSCNTTLTENIADINIKVTQLYTDKGQNNYFVSFPTACFESELFKEGSVGAQSSRSSYDPSHLILQSMPNIHVLQSSSEGWSNLLEGASRPSYTPFVPLS